MSTCVADFKQHPVSVIEQESIFWRQSYDTVLIAIFPGDGPLCAVAATRCFTSALARAMQIKGLGRKVKFVFGTKPSPLCRSFLGIEDISPAIKADLLERNFRNFFHLPCEGRLDDDNGYDGMRWAVRLVAARPPQPSVRDLWCDPDTLGDSLGAAKSFTDPGAGADENSFRDAWRSKALWSALKSAPTPTPTPAHVESPLYAGASHWASTFNATYRRTWLDFVLTVASIAIAFNSFAWPYYAYKSCWNDVASGLYAVLSILSRAVCQAYVQRVRFRAAFDGAIPEEAAADCAPMLVAYSPDGDRIHGDLVRNPSRYRVPVAAWGLYASLGKVVIDIDEQDWYSTGILIATQLNAFAVLFIVALWRNMTAVIFSLSALTHFTAAVAWNNRMEKSPGRNARDRQFNGALRRANAAYAAAGFCPGPERWSATPADPKFSELVRYLNRRRDSALDNAADVRNSVMRLWLSGRTGSRHGPNTDLRAPLLGT